MRDAQLELQEGLRQWLRKPNGEMRYTAQRHREALLQLRGAMGRVRSMGGDVSDMLQTSYNAISETQLEHMLHEYARLGSVFGSPSRLIDIDTAAVVAVERGPLFMRFESSAQRYAGDVGRDIQRELALGILKGETVFELTERLVLNGGPRGEVALRGILGDPDASSEVIAEGLFRRYRHWASRLARTELQRASNVVLDRGIFELSQYDSEIIRRWDASVDSRLCEICFALHGQTAPIDGYFAGGYESAPAHPYCRCRVGAWKAAWEQYRRWMMQVDQPWIPDETRG